MSRLQEKKQYLDINSLHTVGGILNNRSALPHPAVQPALTHLLSTMVTALHHGRLSLCLLAQEDLEACFRRPALLRRLAHRCRPLFHRVPLWRLLVTANQLQLLSGDLVVTAGRSLRRQNVAREIPNRQRWLHMPL